MTHRYYIAKITGPSGVFAGYILFLFGMVSVYFSLTSIPVIIIGAAMAFSYSTSKIDFGSKRYTVLLQLFGFLPLGSWVDLEPADKIQVKAIKGKYTSFSRGNRSSSAEIRDFQVILNRDSDRKDITLARFKTKEEAEELLNKLQIVLSGD